MAAARELTKKFEEIVRGTPSELLTHFETEGIRGEFVLLLHGAQPAQPEERDLDWAVQRTAQLEADGIIGPADGSKPRAVVK